MFERCIKLPGKPVVQNNILTILAQTPGLNRYELSKDIGSHHHVITKAVEKLEEEEKITKTSNGLANTGDIKYVYTLTESGLFKAVLLGVPFNEVSPKYRDLYETAKTWTALDRLFTQELGKTWTLSKNQFFQQMAAIIQASREFGGTKLELTLSGFLADFLKNSLNIADSVIKHLEKAMKNDPEFGETARKFVIIYK